MKNGFANVQIFFQTEKKEFIFIILTAEKQHLIKKKDLLSRNFYQQFKKNVYFCKLNLNEKKDEKEQK
ncbi:MAG: hypothetical protein IJ634_02630 [Bacteroidales bacterium]|nr:hypothetical protein [Bacteroidales bacterium]